MSQRNKVSTRTAIMACLAVAAPASVAATDADAQVFRPQSQQQQDKADDEKDKRRRNRPVQAPPPQQQAPTQAPGQAIRPETAPRGVIIPRGGDRNTGERQFQPGRDRGLPDPRSRQFQTDRKPEFVPQPDVRERQRERFGRDRKPEPAPSITIEPRRRDREPVIVDPRRDDRQRRIFGRDRDDRGRDATDSRQGERIAPRGFTREERVERRQWRRRNEGPVINLDALKRDRREQRLDRGRTVFEEPDARRIFRSEGRRPFISRDETRRLRRFGRDVTTTAGRDGRNITVLRRRNGVEIITETGPEGRLIRRYRRGPNGREFNLIDNRRTWRRWRKDGGYGFLVNIAPPILSIPRDRYIVDYEDASNDDIYDALSAPPLGRLDRGYTLDEVLATVNLRERMRRIDLDSINFAFGSWEVSENQYDDLERIARAINRLVEENPDEVVLIEGHTDAVGDELDNLSLSDRRAEEVANILTQEFDVPPENLVTQGYGEEFLKVDTDGPERANRRVTVRRVTPLLARNGGERD